MYIYVYSPARFRRFFGSYVDSRLSREKDWVLCSFWNSDQLSRGEFDGFFQVHELILSSFTCATPQSRKVVGVDTRVIRRALDFYAFDLWIFSANTTCSVEELEDDLYCLIKLGCLSTLSLLPIPRSGGLKLEFTREEPCDSASLSESMQAPDISQTWLEHQYKLRS